MDDTDSVVEAKRFMGRTQANALGRWSLTMDTALTMNDGLRTTSTTSSNGVIPGMSAGTTTKLSEGPGQLYRLSIPVYLPNMSK